MSPEHPPTPEAHEPTPEQSPPEQTDSAATPAAAIAPPQPPETPSPELATEATPEPEATAPAMPEAETPAPDMPEPEAASPEVTESEATESEQSAPEDNAAEAPEGEPQEPAVATPELVPAPIESESITPPPQDKPPTAPEADELVVEWTAAEPDPVPRVASESTEPESTEPEAVPSASTPEIPPKPSVAPAPPVPQSQTLQVLQKVWAFIQPKLTALAIALVKGVIWVLEFLLARLEGRPLQFRAAKQATGAIAGQPTVPGKRTAVEQGWAIAKQLPQTIIGAGRGFWRWWESVLPILRKVLPASVNETVPNDRILSGAIAGILVLVLWVGSAIFSSHPPTPVATAPPKTPDKTAIQPKPTPSVAASPTPSIAPSPIAQPSIAPSPAPVTAPSPSPSPVVIATPTPAPTITPTPAPPLRLTPEQKLIARIQDQVAEVSDRYAPDLIQSVQANFRASRLTVNVSEAWYDLEAAQQDKLASDLFQRAKQLDFVKLELADPEAVLLARSPVVGTEMLIFARQATPEATPETVNPS